MPTLARDRGPTPYPIRIPILTLAVLALAAALLAGPAAAATSKTVAKEAENETIGKTILTTTRGRTLYSLSAEKNGRFICTDAGCRASWRPLVVGKGVKPKGPVKLGVIVRPDGRRQVTFKGLPLYSFNGDVRKGEVNGEGFKDVGTWHAAVTGPLQSSTEAQPQPETPAPNPYPPSEPHPPYPY